MKHFSIDKEIIQLKTNQLPPIYDPFEFCTLFSGGREMVEG